MLALLAAPAWRPPAAHAGHTSRTCRPAMSLVPGDSVLVCGNGPVMLLAAKLAALKGFQTTCAMSERDLALAPSLIYTDTHTEGSIPLSCIPISGPEADPATVEDCVSSAKGLIIAFDSEVTMPERALNVFMPEESAGLKRVAVMSRYLNGQGMGFFASAAKVAANTEIWAGEKTKIEEYRQMENMITARAKKLGAGHTIIRAGTLKGGGIGDSLGEGGGEPSFLNPKFYTLGQQDVVNWRLLYDCDVLGVDLEAGDRMSGPGFLAATTATSSKGGPGTGESHRGAVATALVEALLCPQSLDRDFSVGAKEGRQFPDASSWQQMFASASSSSA